MQGFGMSTVCSYDYWEICPLEFEKFGTAMEEKFAFHCTNWLNNNGSFR